jgi:excisionase family DNA binding protein
MPVTLANSTSEPLMTVSDVAQLLRKSEAWVYRNSRSGALPTVLVGRSRRFSSEDLDEWIRRHRR